MSGSRFQDIATVLEEAPVAAFVAEDGRFAYVNRAFETGSGYGRDELVGMHALALVVPEHREPVRRANSAVLRGRRRRPVEFRSTRCWGSCRPP